MAGWWERPPPTSSISLTPPPPLRAAPGPPPAPPNAQPQASLRGENHSLRSRGEETRAALGRWFSVLGSRQEGWPASRRAHLLATRREASSAPLLVPPGARRATLGGKYRSGEVAGVGGLWLRWQERPPPASSISLTPPPPFPGCTRPPSGSPQSSASGFAQGRESLASPETPLPPSEYSPQRRASPSWGEKRTRPPPGEETGPTFEIIGALLHASRVRRPGLSYPQPKTDNRQQPACGLCQLSAVSSSQRTSTASTSASRSPELSMR